MTGRREPLDEGEAKADAPRAARFGMEQTENSETSRGTTPVGHGSVGVTQDHEAAQDVIMGERDDGAAGAHGERAPERVRAQLER